MAAEPTREELVAARALGEAMLRFLVAHETAKMSRVSTCEPGPEVDSGSTNPSPGCDQRRRDDRMSDNADGVEENTGLPAKLLLGGREAAELLSVCQRTLWSMTAPRGPIPCVQIGRSVRYPVGELREWIQKATKRKR